MWCKSKRSARLSIICVAMALLILSGCEYDPTLAKVMTKDQVFGSTAFEGDVDVNASGQWIACSRNGVFLSNVNDPSVWQQIKTAANDSTSPNDPMVNASTVKILCRISNDGKWIMINRAGIYRSSQQDNTVGVLVTASVAADNIYDLDMEQVSGNWIASSGMITYACLTGQMFGQPQVIATSGDTMNGSGSPRRIVKVNAQSDWIILTKNGVWKNLDQVLFNPSSLNINGISAYWSLDMNAQGDWVMINSKGTFKNGVRVTGIESVDVGEMEVRITDRNTDNVFTWMAISPRGIFRNGVLQSVEAFATNQVQYSLDLNNNGDWVAVSEAGALYNGTRLKNDGFDIQPDTDSTTNFICRINDYKDILCMTDEGIFRSEKRGQANLKVALANSSYFLTSQKHLLRLGTEGAVVALLDSTPSSGGVYWGMNLPQPPPPAPTNINFDPGTFTFSWLSGGGSSKTFEIYAGTVTPTPSNPGKLLYAGNAETFQLSNLSSMDYDSTYHISIRAGNEDGGTSAFQEVTTVKTGKFTTKFLARNPQQDSVTLHWKTLPGKSYRVLWSENLVDWYGIPPNVSPTIYTAAPGEWDMEKEINDPGSGAATRRFYKVVTFP
jgi:hypothetical protein